MSRSAYQFVLYAFIWYRRTLCLIQSQKDFILYFILQILFYFLYFELIFVCVGWDMEQGSSRHDSPPPPPSLYIQVFWLLPFPEVFLNCFNCLCTFFEKSIIWLHFYTLYSVPLIYLSDVSPILYRPDYYSFIIILDVFVFVVFIIMLNWIWKWNYYILYVEHFLHL